VIHQNTFSAWLLPIMIVCAASGFYYYFKVIRAMYWDRSKEEVEPIRVPVITAIMLTIFSAILIIAGIAPLFLTPIH
jgi:NADH-quinone oxidoreductase subunit N